ncbi:MAG: hypothetical protein KA533_05640 [Sphingobium sp.]|nr:hypothetical protein [Sphingobium sp.]MBP6111607.1 hypothetical protein [Sphingobium sp.]MBP8670944.1 hypothetical protein [Sphingobium sp.]MBP9158089.1 hypothetical protein [Sphingobium sp.]MCC6481993.1 hypothetical protein [Sphingomonadaceae bacterium]
MKKLLLLLILLLLGLSAGAGAAYGIARWLGPPPPKAATKPTEADTLFVPGGTILAPIVASDGRLSGYANFEVQLEVMADREAEVTGKLPLLLHAINLRTWNTPMASGPDHILPDLRVFARIVQTAADEALGHGAVMRVIVMGAKPV